MNKRIEDLLGQAYDEAVPETWTTLSSEQLGRIYEKFAESIVQECISLCEEVDDINKTYDTEFGPKECIKVIKTYFGVEE